MLRLILVLTLLPLPPPPPFPTLVSVAPPVSPRLERRVLAMGTELSLQVGGGGDLARASEAALAECARIESACSTWDPASDWSRVNAARGACVSLAAEWLDLLEQVAAWSKRTGGAFDPVLGALMEAWGVRRGGGEPAPQVWAQAREASGARLLELDRRAGTVNLVHPCAGLEEGGFLKGYALDRMKVVAGTPEGRLDIGGQLLAWGRPVEAAVADPRDRQRPRLSLTLRDASLATSGTSERGRHILDPRSGRPCPAWGAVAVVAPSGLEADILSTALYVLGPETGLAWAEGHRVAAAFLSHDGAIRLSTAFQSLHPVHL